MEPETSEELQVEPGGGLDVAPDPWAIGGAVVAVLLIGVAIASYLRSRSIPFEVPGLRLPTSSEDEASAEAGTPVAEEPPVGSAPEEGLAPPAVVEPGLSVLERFRTALDRSRSVLRESLQRLLGGGVDEAGLESLEEALLASDVGVETAQRLVSTVRESARSGELESATLDEVLRQEMRTLLEEVHEPLRPLQGPPHVILVVGVNGSGKTTTIGKLAHRYGAEGRKVMLAAGDTFRAAAAEQLEVWAQRTGAGFTRLEEGADPGAVAFRALERAETEGHEVVIIDTAGRLQTRKPLMEQLGKVRRVIGKRIPDAPHETLLVLDGTMGQNGMSQARLFHEATPLTGVVVTKLDGTAKGGMVLAIASELALPVKLVGLGEQAADLRDFEPRAFVEALV